jgi:hypothetical protein
MLSLPVPIEYRWLENTGRADVEHEMNALAPHGGVS